MILTTRRRTLTSLGLLALVGLVPLHTPLHATEPPPRLDVESDSAEFDQAEGTAVFIGNVIATRGETRLEGERLFARQLDGDLQAAELEGKPGTFHHRNEEGELINGHARLIIYDPATEQIDLHGEAYVQRGREEFSGEHIRYLAAEDRISASGEGRGRVRTTLYPDGNEDETEDDE